MQRSHFTTLAFLVELHAGKCSIQILENFIQRAHIALCIERFHTKSRKGFGGFVCRCRKGKDNIPQCRAALAALNTTIGKNTEGCI